MRLMNIFIMWILSFSVILGQQPFPTVDLEQSTDIIHLKDKVSTLEAKIKVLEDKIKQLEQNKSVKTKDDGNIQYSGDWEILANWRKLETSMSYNDVKDLLGEPKKVRGGWRSFILLLHRFQIVRPC